MSRANAQEEPTVLKLLEVRERVNKLVRLQVTSDTQAEAAELLTTIEQLRPQANDTQRTALKHYEQLLIRSFPQCEFESV